jgi:hypothetical protein
MSRQILESPSRFADAQGLAGRPPIPSDLAEQVRFLADGPSEGVIWSDVFAQLRGGLNTMRRLLAERGSHAKH